MKIYKAFQILFILSLSPGLLAEEEQCAVLGAESIKTVKEFIAKANMLSEVKLDPKFCEAVQACNNGVTWGPENQIKEMEKYYQGLPESIASTKKQIEEIQKVSTKDQDPDYLNYYKKSLKTLEDDYSKYQAYLKDPQQIPHPMKEKGYGLTPEETEAFQEKQMEEQDKQFAAEQEKYYLGLEANIQSLKAKQKQIEDKGANATIQEQHQLNNFKYHLDIAQKDFTKYQNHLADPKNIPHPMKAKGIGLSKEEKNQIKKKQSESYYQNMKVELESSLQYLEKSKNQLAFAIEKKASQSEIADMQFMLEQSLSEIEQTSAIYKGYEDYLKNPEANPKFLLQDPYKLLMTYRKKKTNNCSTANNIYRGVLSLVTSRGIGTCGLSPEELISIKYYSDNGYGCMNTYLRSKKNDNEKINYLVDTLNRGLSKLPKYQGIVKRGASLPEDIRNQHEKGSIVTYDAYTSTSTSGGFGGSDIFYIYSASGRPMMGFSIHEGESEVLFKSGTKFKVLSKDTQGGKQFQYVLKEISEDQDEKTQQKIEEEILSSLKNKNPNKKEYDTWFCPKDETKEVPKMIKQESMPQ